MTLIPVRKEGKMKTLALIVLMMVMGLSGCASIAGTGLSWKDIKENWRWYLG
jgi:hypothetical protein